MATQKVAVLLLLGALKHWPHEAEEELRARIKRKLRSRLELCGVPKPITSLGQVEICSVYWPAAFNPWRGSAPHAVHFHRDEASVVVVNVALNEDYEGGVLMFALEDPQRLEVPSRPAGCATVHHAATVHAVSQLEGGVRYSLFAVFEAAPTLASLAAQAA